MGTDATKPGSLRRSSIEDEWVLTLMKIKLNLIEDYDNIFLILLETIEIQ